MFQILVAENDKNTARLMKEILKHNGYEFTKYLRNCNNNTLIINYILQF